MHSISRLISKSSRNIFKVHAKFSSNVNSQQKDRSILFSGIQPTGSIHVGNYLGAIKPWKKFQDDKNHDDVQKKLIFILFYLFYFIVFCYLLYSFFLDHYFNSGYAFFNFNKVCCFG
jgi:hypothetical protein